MFMDIVIIITIIIQANSNCGVGFSLAIVCLFCVFARYLKN